MIDLKFRNISNRIILLGNFIFLKLISFHFISYHNHILLYLVISYKCYAR